MKNFLKAWWYEFKNNDEAWSVIAPAIIAGCAVSFILSGMFFGVSLVVPIREFLIYVLIVLWFSASIAAIIFIMFYTTLVVILDFLRNL